VSITVDFIGPVRRPGPERRLTLEVGDGGLAVAALLTRLGYLPDEGARLTVLVAGRRAGADERVPDGVHIEILLPVGGG
jgi:sulfur carrier protein ThiS